MANSDSHLRRLKRLTVLSEYTRFSPHTRQGIAELLEEHQEGASSRDTKPEDGETLGVEERLLGYEAVKQGELYSLHAFMESATDLQPTNIGSHRLKMRVTLSSSLLKRTTGRAHKIEETIRMSLEAR